MSLFRAVATNNAKPTAPLEAQNPIPEDLPLVPAEAHDVIVADTISGAPRELRLRTVRIFQPTRNTMQSGGAKGERWRIEFDTLPGSGRWENPLMGYASSADYMQGTRITFRSKDDCDSLCGKARQQETVKRVPPKNYSENYLYKADKLRILKTK
ncbi:ETC complex I subunit conserved region-domain-containing protein [Flagelloscypha sp. PMI_526]|nr:ETC complex I subunit conserved region-domain-containing protein [Flagelloscypha sp. PMI_526]